MATKIRLRRTGTTNLATFRIVAADERSPRDGRFLETLGSYDPRKEGEEKVQLNVERAQYWVSVGAQVTPKAISLLKSKGVVFPSKATKKAKEAQE
ncbi:30S ribosomal protein S16 [bacterium]|nr:30S ribosomal protein S16 [bacterium]